MFLRSGNILDLVFTLTINRIGDVNIHCPFPHCGHCPIVFDYIYEFSYGLTPKKLSKQAWWKGKYRKIDIALDAVDWDFELSDLSVTDMFSKLQSIMSPLVNMYVPLIQENPLNKSVEPHSHLKRQRSMAWHYYKNLLQRN